MGLETKKAKKKYANFYNEVNEEIEAEVNKDKADFVPFTDGKVQLLVESTTDGKGNEGKANEYTFYQMTFKILSGQDEGRTIKRKFYMPKDPANPTEKDEKTKAKTKKCLSSVGITKIKSLGEALESLEDCVIGATIWTPPENNQYGMKISIPFFNEMIKNGDDEGDTNNTPDDIEY